MLTGWPARVKRNAVSCSTRAVLPAGRYSAGSEAGSDAARLLLAAGIAHQPAELDILDGLRGAVAHLMRGERASLPALAPSHRVAGKGANRENRERQTARCARGRAPAEVTAGARSTRTSSCGRATGGDAIEHGLPQAP